MMFGWLLHGKSLLDVGSDSLISGTPSLEVIGLHLEGVEEKSVPSDSRVVIVKNREAFERVYAMGPDRGVMVLITVSARSVDEISFSITVILDQWRSSCHNLRFWIGATGEIQCSLKLLSVS